MKVAWKIVLIIALILLVLGAALIGVSLFFGGSVESVRNNVPLMQFAQDFPDETLTALRVELPGGRLTVENGSVLRVEAVNVPEGCFECFIEDGVLTVRETRDASWSNTLSRLISLHRREPEYHVWLPEGAVLTSAELRVAGQTQIQGLTTQLLQLTTAGDTAVTGLRAQTAEIDAAAGKLSLFELDTDSLLLQAGAGSIGVSGTVRSRCSVDLGAGEATLKLTGSAADYTAQVEVLGGEIVYDGQSCGFGSCVLGNGSGYMSLRCGAGNIRVQFFG